MITEGKSVKHSSLTYEPLIAMAVARSSPNHLSFVTHPASCDLCECLLALFDADTTCPSYTIQRLQRERVHDQEISRGLDLTAPIIQRDW